MDKYYRFIRTLRFATLLLMLVSTQAFSANSAVRFNELMAGLNGDSSIQFIELAVADQTEKAWGPARDELVGRAMLVFYDQSGTETSRYVIPRNPRGVSGNSGVKGNDSTTVLFATKAFIKLTKIDADFVIPPMINANHGKVCFKNNPDNTQESINLCLSYGEEFGGDPESQDGPNPQTLPILGSVSLSRNVFSDIGSGLPIFGEASHRNSDFVLTAPSPASTQASRKTGQADTLFAGNALGEVLLPLELDQITQGRNLFFKETFNGNGRTCLTCHKEEIKFGLTPDVVAALPSTDPLFRNEQNINTLIVRSANGQAMAKPSDYFVGDTLKGSLGGSAQVLAVTTFMLSETALEKQYLVVDGVDLNISGNVIKDSQGNSGTLFDFQMGDLSGPNPVNGSVEGLEVSRFLRGGRALIFENINGFQKSEFLRASPSLMNLAVTAPYGLSEEFPDLNSFAKGAIEQHFPRSLSRVPGVDFRPATVAELDAMTAFQNSLVSLTGANVDVFSPQSIFVTTELQRKGRDLFFGEASCTSCHNSTVLSGGARFTGVSNLPINVTDGLPTEQFSGAPKNTRAFGAPSLFDVHFTAPFFHDNSVATLTEAVEFYGSEQFANSDFGGPILAVQDPEKRDALVAFLNGLVQAPFTFTQLISVIDTPIGESKDVVARITNTGSKNAKIDAVRLTGQNPGVFSVEVGKLLTTLKPGAVLDFGVKYSPTINSNSSAILEFDIKVGTEIYSVGIRLLGSTSHPSISIDPTMLEFTPQDVDAGPMQGLPVNINNAGSAVAQLVLHSVELIGVDANSFSIFPPFTTEIDPGGTTSISVIFNPQGLGVKNATIRIRSNDPLMSIKDVPIKGTAIIQKLVSLQLSAIGSDKIAVGSFGQVAIVGVFTDGSIKTIVGAVDGGGFFVDGNFDLRLQSSNPLVANVDIGGVPSILGEAEGTSMITAIDNRNSNVVSNELLITVVPPPPPPVFISLSITPSNPTLVQGDSLFLNAFGLADDGRSIDLTNDVQWTSSDSTVVQTNVFGGFSIARNPGIAIITATTLDGRVSNSTRFTVTPFVPQPLPPGITVVSFETVPAAVTAERGSFVQLSAVAILTDGSTMDITPFVGWSVANTTVVAAGPFGVVELLNVGQTTIVARLPNGLSAARSTSVTVTENIPPVTPPLVTPPPIPLPPDILSVDVEIVPASLSIALGQQAQLTAIANLIGGGTVDITFQVLWGATNPSILNILPDGSFIAVGLGSATILVETPGAVVPVHTATITVANSTSPQPTPVLQP